MTLSRRALLTVAGGAVAASSLRAAGQVGEGPATGAFALRGRLSQGGIAIGTAPAGTMALSLDGAAIPVADDGRFLIAFDRDASSTAVLAAERVGAAPLVEPLTIAPRAWRIENLATLPRVPVPSATFAAVRAGELAAIAAARTQASDADGWAMPFRWPATGRISGLFGAQRIYRGEPGAYHGGTDVAVPEGTPVHAPADGVVTLVADPPYTLEGRLVMVDHGMALVSAFLHLSRADVTVGQRVSRGAILGAVGHTGRATGPHLHWGVTWRTARLDPLLVAGDMPR